MSKCLVVSRNKLEATPLWQKLNKVDGIISAAVLLLPSEIQELLNTIKNNSVFLEREGRNGVEKNQQWQQIIFYGLIVQKNKFFLYRRGETEYKERRLQSRVSAGIGGHIEPSDTNDLITSLKREINEELKFFKEGEEIPMNGTFPKIQIIGLIKDEKDTVGRLHLGVVCLIELTNDVEIDIKSSENVWGQMVTLCDYQQIQYIPEG